MIPISDENPTRLRPYVTWAFVLACIAVFFWQLSFSEQDEEALIYSLAFVPDSVFFGVQHASGIVLPSVWLTLLTSMFLHGGFLHLGGNMLYLWIFGNNVEDAMGHLRYFLFYLVCGIAAALSQGLADPHADIPMLGASGAISGVIASYVLIFPRARITVIIPLGILLYPMKISAFYVVGFWFLIQLLNLAGAPSGMGGTAWLAHVGGFGRPRGGPWG
jgi:membrane associated rhomboid family serine protease